MWLGWALSRDRGSGKSVGCTGHVLVSLAGPHPHPEGVGKVTFHSARPVTSWLRNTSHKREVRLLGLTLVPGRTQDMAALLDPGVPSRPDWVASPPVA